MKTYQKAALLILSLGAAAGAQAYQPLPHGLRHDAPPVAAPEIDPASAMSAFTLLAGGLVVIRGKRARK